MEDDISGTGGELVAVLLQAQRLLRRGITVGKRLLTLTSTRMTMHGVTECRAVVIRLETLAHSPSLALSGMLAWVAEDYSHTTHKANTDISHSRSYVAPFVHPDTTHPHELRHCQDQALGAQWAHWPCSPWP